MAELEEKEVAAERDADLPIPDILPVLPLKDVVVFPYIILPLSVSREKSINAVDAALAEQRIIMLVAQRDAQNDDPAAGRALPGRHRRRDHADAQAARRAHPPPRPGPLARAHRLGPRRGAVPQGEDHAARGGRARRGAARPSTRRCCAASSRTSRSPSSLGKNISPEVMVIAGNLDDPARLADLAASNLDLKLEEAQKILESTDADRAAARSSTSSLAKEITVLTMQQEISTQARGEMDKSQREYYLRQQLRAIQQELGEGEEISEELDALPQDHRRQEDPAGGRDRDREADQAPRARATPTRPRPRSSAPTSTG